MSSVDVWVVVTLTSIQVADNKQWRPFHWVTEAPVPITTSSNVCGDMCGSRAPIPSQPPPAPSSNGTIAVGEHDQSTHDGVFSSHWNFLNVYDTSSGGHTQHNISSTAVWLFFAIILIGFTACFAYLCRKQLGASCSAFCAGCCWSFARACGALYQATETVEYPPQRALIASA